MDKDQLYMYRCLTLAGYAAGSVAPNPMVGAVLVHENKIVGEGYHKQYGKAHAEVNCISAAEKTNALTPHQGRPGIHEIFQYSTLYVSLEPCAHFGKTPPCADLIIEKRIPKVVVGCRDPFSLVDGKGIDKLRQAGVDVRIGVLESQCRDLNKRFFTFHNRQRPYIILKWAQTTDAKIAGTGNSRLLITNEITNRLVHKWRSEEAGIMVGTNTALLDNPSLNTRLWPGSNPRRIVLDMNERLPPSLHIFNGEVDTIVFNSLRHDEKDGVVYYRLDPALPLVPQICGALYLLNVQSFIVEGGAKLLKSFIDAGLWDEARIITNNEMMAGQGIGSPGLPGAVLIDRFNINSDTVRIFENSNRI